MASSSLVKALTTPNKIASALDWRKVSGSTILSLDIHKDRIGLAVASHPSCHESVTVLTPLRLDPSHSHASTSTSTSTTSRTTTSTSSSVTNHTPCPKKRTRLGALEDDQRATLSNIVSTYNVCGVVVSWPLQQDTGKMGAACGHVLNTLEDLVSAQQQQQQQQQQPPSSSPHVVDIDTDTTESTTTTTTTATTTTHTKNLVGPILQNRPICLWDLRHIQETIETVDPMGRSVSYCHKQQPQRGGGGGGGSDTEADLEPTLRDQFTHDETLVAVQVWEDFCRVHWPNDVIDYHDHTHDSHIHDDYHDGMEPESREHVM